MTTTHESVIMYRKLPNVPIVGYLKEEENEDICLIRLKNVSIDVGWYGFFSEPSFPHYSCRVIAKDYRFDEYLEEYSSPDWEKVKQFAIDKTYEYMTEDEKVEYL